jgi:hypothetical protein
LFANVALFLFYGLLKNFAMHLLMTLSVSMKSVFFVHASDSPGADNSILSSDKKRRQGEQHKVVVDIERKQGDYIRQSS